MATPHILPPTGARSIWTEHLAHSRLRIRYQPDRFSPEEWRRLSFLRWLSQTGRIQP